MISKGAFLLLAAAVSVNAATKPTVTYAKDVAPILFKNCSGCHRPGENTPMSLLSYQDTRPWAKAIKDGVVTRKRPPWFAEPNIGHFANDWRLSQAEIDTIGKWADAGAPQGNAADMPPTPKYTEGWVLGEPDVVIQMPASYDVPAEGVIPYKYFTAPTGFTEDKWIRGIEVRPGNRKVVHHIILNLREPGTGGRLGSLGGTAPGLQPSLYREGSARLVKAGAEIQFQMHYTPNGTAASDRSYVGIYFAKEPPTIVAKSTGIMNTSFRIPPGDGNFEVKSTWTAPEDVILTGMMPHMHLRGKDFKYTVIYPDGRTEVLLSVPRYDFNWQLHYTLQDPLTVPKGSKVEVSAHYDNSPGNKFNPDPGKEVRWGDQTFEEMMIGYLDYQPIKK